MAPAAEGCVLVLVLGHIRRFAVVSVADEPPIDEVNEKSRWQEQQTYSGNVALSKRMLRNPRVLLHPEREWIE